MTCTQDSHRTARHTPEPWEYADSGLIYGQCGEDDDEAPFVCDVVEDSAMQAFGTLSPVEEANARRICAAVNACRGVSTEALEQGAIADLRHALQALLDTTADLDAAIDGATDQFDGERAELDAAWRNAHAALAKADGGPEQTEERTTA
ncbi:MAG TPA: hypothetical protein VJ739_11820 [Gemmataceae bacterium]|nr:hypothetical protein [Gemmataceae bacterium]